MKNNNRYLLVLYQMQVMLRRLAQRYDRETHISWRYTYVQYSECLHTDGSIYYYSKVVHILVPLLPIYIDRQWGSTGSRYFNTFKSFAGKQ